MRERSAAGLAESLQALLHDYPERAAIRRHAEAFSWTQTTQDQLDLFSEILLLEKAVA
jgi:hypothetical protein